MISRTLVTPKISKPNYRKIRCVSIPKSNPIINYVDALMEIGIRRKSFTDICPRKVTKLGESSFSEVFICDDLIYKIIPLSSSNSEYTFEDFCRECYVQHVLSNEAGVCCMNTAFCVEGKYPASFLEAWRIYELKHGSENMNILNYGKKQRYGVIVMENGGTDLEHYEFRRRADLKSFISQILEVLNRLEDKFEFEHRDLHWGNILINDKMRVKIIDFSISRINLRYLSYTNLNNKPWLFEGDEKVDEQFGIYKILRSRCNGNWSFYNPKSNLLWVGYLLRKLKSKLLKPGVTRFIDKLIMLLVQSRNLSEFRALTGKYL